jgi:hypothetical protein
MICNVCGSQAFDITEYRPSRDGTCRAPAFECRGCGAISLREEAAASDKERESVKIAIAMRARVTDESKPPVGAPDPRLAVTTTARIKVR